MLRHYDCNRYRNGRDPRLRVKWNDARCDIASDPENGFGRRLLHRRTDIVPGEGDDCDRNGDSKDHKAT